MENEMQINVVFVVIVVVAFASAECSPFGPPQVLTGE